LTLPRNHYAKTAMTKPTAKDRRYFNAVVDLGCIICGGPAEIHHSRHGLGMGQRDHSRVIPLCPYHHRLSNTSRHLAPGRFADLYGTDKELERKTERELRRQEKMC